MTLNPVHFAQSLMRCASITPLEAGTLALLEEALKPLGFVCHRQVFHGVDNLYARRGESAPNLCFAGHVDVVPPGDLAAWEYDPFSATIEGGMLYGRGASDMKAAIAAWVAAVASVPAPARGSISLLITCDEEGPGVHGTKQMLEWLKARGETIEGCIIGEPTNPSVLGEMVKIGRRGSIGFTLEVQGVQGHVAYPEKADNPVTRLLSILQQLKGHKLDDGTKFFPPSNLEITSVDVGNAATNVIPAKASALFNIRFNDRHKGADMAAWVEGVCRQSGANYTLKHHISAESFFCPPGKLAPLIAEAVRKETGRTPEFSTTGGTSDGRFLHRYCPELVECGLVNDTAHKVNESASVTEIEALTRIYTETIRRYFA